MDWKKKFFNLLRLLISGILIIWMLKMVDVSQLTESLATAELWIIALTIIPIHLDRVLMAYKWGILLRAKGIRTPFIDLVSSYFKASFLGSLFLPTVGADAVRIFEVSRQTRRSEDIISSVVLERFLGLVASFVVGIFSFVLLLQMIESAGWTSLVQLLLVLILAVVILVASLKIEWARKMVSKLPFVSEKVVTKLDSIIASYQDYNHHRSALVLFFLLSVLEQFEPVLSSYMVAQAFHLDIPFIAFLTFIPFIMMAIRLPISFDGFGVREGLYIYLFGLIGVAEPDAFLVGFVLSTFSRIVLVPVTLYFFLRHKTTIIPGAEEAGQQTVPAPYETS